MLPPPPPTPPVPKDATTATSTSAKTTSEAPTTSRKSINTTIKDTTTQGLTHNSNIGYSLKANLFLYSSYQFLYSSSGGGSIFTELHLENAASLQKYSESLAVRLALKRCRTALDPSIIAALYLLSTLA